MSCEVSLPTNYRKWQYAIPNTDGMEFIAMHHTPFCVVLTFQNTPLL